jgi:hypothetical protein
MPRPDRGIDVRDLFGGRSLSQKAVRQSMGALEKRLTAEFKERTRVNAEIRKHSRALSASLNEEAKGVAEAVTGLRRLATSLRGRRLVEPPYLEAREQVYVGSIGAVRKPPFDYQWTWSAASGNPEGSESADRQSGKMFFQLYTDDDNSSSMSGRTAVGIYFYPPAECGDLQVWASPSFTDQWWDFCTFDSAHADGWIGLYIQSYDLTDAPTATLVDQQISLWSDSSWWSGTSGQGSNTGYGLYAPPMQVDQDHQYAIWVWAGGDVSADGWGTISGSVAGDVMNIAVPFIRWELG